MTDILEEALKYFPEGVEITNKCFEGANIVVYTKDREFFLNNNGAIRKVVEALKKRIELRMDPSKIMDLEKAEEIIKSILPEEAKTSEIIFDSQRSRVIMEVEKPGLAIGKGGEILKEIKRKTLWTPLIKRTPAIESKIIKTIRHVLYENNDYRKKFLNDVGKRIYGGWTKEKRSEWVRLTFLGGGRQVGRSCLLLQTQESKVMLDCGVNIAAQGQDAFPYLDVPEFNIEELDAVICSHAHLDHSGLIPYLYKMGYRGPTYFTAPTRDIASLLALDYISVSYKEAKKGLYTSTDIKEMVKHTICLDYNEVTDITPDIRVTLYNSGHTLGSAQVHLHIGNGLHNLLYTGDMKFDRTKLLETATTKFPRLETVVIESTYGSKEDILPSRRKSEQEVIDLINKTTKRGGKVLIPVLGVGRAQEVMLILEDAIKNGLINKVPVFLDGMLWDVTAIHTAYPDFLNKNIKKAIFHKDQDPFLSDIFKRVGSQKERDEVITESGPCVILATSGMMQGGASVSYFKELADNAKNSLMFVCYQANGSLGNRIQSGEKEIMTGNGDKNPDVIKVEMEIINIVGLTGHSGRNQLISFIYQLEPKPKRVIVNHGESSKCLELASTLHKLNKIETNAPKNLETIRIK
ncbi:beta-CASP ribonuclease aCPSF1 [archaeon]|nr:beta-CASP ribonuclease aCPSF1 [archaeon]|tara:strand:+ start:871 stop:2772 length:1902 start_codon:yes stop_codon:yes gene_type:complete